MIQYRDKLGMELKLTLLVGQNEEAIKAGRTFPATQHLPEGHPDKLSRLQCCKALKTDALNNTLSGTWPRKKLNLKTGVYELDPNREPFNGVVVGARADEEGSRSKERYFSPRGKNNLWDVGEQPPEFWNQFKTDFAPGTHVRIHPLLDWTELHIWEYIKRENIPTVSLYYDQGEGTRYRSLGCAPCQAFIQSTAKNVEQVIEEIKSGKLKNISERSGRLQDGKHGLEELRREGYM
jgi:sulfate adenylyltransferase subunit 2